eukprot:scaffold2742_cov140-Skeletonema_marinoi.AAC.1
MTSFFLADLVSDSSSAAAFDQQLHDKLVSPNDVCFNAVRCLFRESASALEQEITQEQELAHETESCNVLTHWIPGRIEVMGKHTDYAGGNSLVCSTEGRGMAMVSTMAPAAEGVDPEGLGQRKITIVSVLADGMEHRAMNSAAPFSVNGRTVVHHSIDISDDSMNKDDTANNDWRIYPKTTIRRLEKNFGLFAHCRETTTTDEEGGYHIIVAISSNLPPASGLSTSSCFVTGLFLVLDSHLDMRSSHLYRQAIGTADEEDTIYNLSTYLGNIENGTCYIRQRVKRTGIDATTEERNIVLEGTKNGDGVGTFGGSEDHAAILMGKKRKLTLLSFCPTRPASFAVDQLNGLTVCNSEDIDTESKDVNQKSELELPSKLVFVIAYSGARAEKAGQGTEASIGYNYASDMASKAFKAYNACSTAAIHDDEQKKLHTLADSIRYERKKQSISHVTSCEDQVKKFISDKVLKGSAAVRGDDHATVADFGNLLTKRFEQFYEESEVLVPTAAYCLAESDRLQMLGPIVDKSHRNAVNILKNQIKETAWLPLWARGIEHQLKTKPTLYVDESKKSEQAPRNLERITAFASSAFGAGFGGSCWALVYRDEAEKFLLQWRSAYDEAFPANW